MMYVLLLYNSKFGDCVDCNYPIDGIELEIMDTTYTEKYISFLDIHLEIVGLS